MNVRRSLLAGMILAGAGLLAAGLAGPAAGLSFPPGPGLAGPAGADAVPETRFYADSGDPCPMGATRGLLRWGSESVSVSGTVVDRPLPSDADTRCGEDGRYTTATFTAYVGTTPVATGSGRADNGATPIAFRLDSRRPIERVVVVVCRQVPAVAPPAVGPPAVGPPAVCGRAAEFPDPRSGRRARPGRGARR